MKKIITTLCCFAQILYAPDYSLEEEQTTPLHKSASFLSDHPPLSDITEEEHAIRTESAKEAAQPKHEAQIPHDIHIQITDLQDNTRQWHQSMNDVATLAKTHLHLEHENILDGQTGELKINDPYKLLDVPSNANLTDIRRAYKKAVLKFHPDKLAAESPSVQALGEAKFKEIQTAYTLLTTPELKESFDLFQEYKKPIRKRLKGTHAAPEVIEIALEHATTMITAIHDHLAKLKNGTLKQHELEELNESLKSEYQQLKSLLSETESNIHLDGESLQAQIRTWAKAMLDNIQSINEQLNASQPSAEEELEESVESPTERTDEEYTNWLYQHPTSVTSPVHNEGRTPLQEALAADSPQMAQNIISAAEHHGVTMKKLLQPIKEEYAQLKAQGKLHEAAELESNIYKIGNSKLTNAFYKEVQRIDRISPTPRS